jgi:hypothetical protein
MQEHILPLRRVRRARMKSDFALFSIVLIFSIMFSVLWVRGGGGSVFMRWYYVFDGSWGEGWVHPFSFDNCCFSAFDSWRGGRFFIFLSSAILKKAERNSTFVLDHFRFNYAACLDKMVVQLLGNKSKSRVFEPKAKWTLRRAVPCHLYMHLLRGLFKTGTIRLHTKVNFAVYEIRSIWNGGRFDALYSNLNFLFYFFFKFGRSVFK